MEKVGVLFEKIADFLEKSVNFLEKDTRFYEKMFLLYGKEKIFPIKAAHFLIKLGVKPELFPLRRCVQATGELLPVSSLHFTPHSQNRLKKGRFARDFLRSLAVLHGTIEESERGAGVLG